MKNSVVIIGGGQIGSRHLQGLALSQCSLSISVVDPSNASLETCRARFESVSSRNLSTELSLLNDIAQLPKEVDVAIIATNSDHRLQALRNLLTRSKPRGVILEKFLFRTVKEYAIAQDLLNSARTKAWVNCNLRYLKFYQNEKRRHLSPLRMRVSGANWGLGCNSIHFLDLFSYLTGNLDLTLTDQHLSNKIVDAKRAGFTEFFGVLNFESASGDVLTLDCSEKGLKPLTIELSSDCAFTSVSDIGDKNFVISRTAEESIASEIRFPYQSELTQHYVEEILKTDNCSLSTFSDSAKLHLLLVNVFIKHMSHLKSEELEQCPIT